MVSAPPRRNERFDCKDLGDEFLAYDAEQDEIHVLNATAREIYLLCDGTADVDAIRRALAERYGIDEARVRADVDAVLRQMLDLGLVTVDGAD